MVLDGLSTTEQIALSIGLRDLFANTLMMETLKGRRSTIQLFALVLIATQRSVLCPCIAAPLPCDGAGIQCQNKDFVRGVIHRWPLWREWQPCADDNRPLTIETSEQGEVVPRELLSIILQAPDNLQGERDKPNESNASTESLGVDLASRQDSACPLLSLSLGSHRLFPMPLCMSIIALHAFIQQLQPEL